MIKEKISDKPLNAGQEKAVHDILAAIRLGQKTISLSGDAGTGKTHTVAHLIDRIAQATGKDSIVVAFTNKAVKVLSGKGVKGVRTIHKRFYLIKEVKVAHDKKGNLLMDEDGLPDPQMHKEFVPCWQHTGSNLPAGKVNWSDITIVDEASMLHSSTITDLQKMSGVLIMVGDGFQLPPVNDEEHPIGVFNERQHTATLTEPMRQGSDSWILKLASKFRNRQVDIWNPNGLSGLEQPFTEIVRWIGDQESKGESWRVLCAFNDTRYMMHKELRKRVFGRNDLFPVVGDRMVATQNGGDEITNGTEITITRSEIMRPEDIIELNHQIQTTDLSNAFSDTERVVVTRRDEILRAVLPVIDFTSDGGDEGEIRGAYQINMYGYYQTYYPNGDQKLLAALKSLYRIIKPGLLFVDAEFEYSYASTVHKAQGSEYDYVYIVDQRERVKTSITRRAQKTRTMPNMVEQTEMALRWWYTAVTRAKQYVMVIDLGR